MTREPDRAGVARLDRMSNRFATAATAATAGAGRRAARRRTPARVQTILRTARSPRWTAHHA
ncbi:hypothetical protein DR62_07730 [Burkholderia thailandensis]|nr:hypothetical protein DR62_07730 [Burkholderia thailandensis]AOI55388.1 hypothetical protein WI24_26975 [Burkholderia thailandensis]MDD1483774.1 hypothetical protein [Burkholderia thailandensis]MDD1489525.1 hypothetical protein [Burkholderia thailandensis]MDD1495887.1 hypothetical protein [Burkholderia thailandensis]